MLLQATVSGSAYTVEGYSRALLGFSCCSYKATRTETQEGEKKEEEDLNKIAQELRHEPNFTMKLTVSSKCPICLFFD